MGHHVLMCVCVCVRPSVVTFHWVVDTACVLGPRKGLWALPGRWLLRTQEP